MSFTTGAALLDAVVLAVVSREEEGTYGYKITQEIKQALELSESTLYPVLRRSAEEACPGQGKSLRCSQRQGKIHPAV